MTHPERRARIDAIVKAANRGVSVPELVIQFGLGRARICDALRGRGVSYQTGPSKYTPRVSDVLAREKWEAVDWKLRDTDIAKMLSVSRERVRQVRLALGKEQSPIAKKRTQTVALSEWIAANKETLRGMKYSDAKLICPVRCAYETVAHHMKQAGLFPKNGEITRENLKEFCEVTPQGCWHWQTSVNPVTGHARVRYEGGERDIRHISYELFRGPIPEGSCVLARCKTANCANPSHLFLGDMKSACDGKKPPKKLSTQQKEHVRRLYATGRVTFAHLAQRFGVHASQIYNVVKA